MKNAFVFGALLLTATSALAGNKLYKKDRTPSSSSVICESVQTAPVQVVEGKALKSVSIPLYVIESSEPIVEGNEIHVTFTSTMGNYGSTTFPGNVVAKKLSASDEKFSFVLKASTNKNGDLSVSKDWPPMDFNCK